MADTLARQRTIVGSTADWAAHDITLGDGEIALERAGDGSVRAKVGNGVLPFSAAPYLGPPFPAALTYIGNADVTAPPPAANSGDFVTVLADGTVAASWGAPAAGTAVTAGQIIVKDETGNWNVQGSAVDLGDVVTRSELSGDGGSAMVGFLQLGAGAVLRSMEDKGREWVSVEDFGAVGGGVTDDTDAILAAVAALPESGGRLRLLDRHAISERIDIRKPVIFEGLAEGSAFQPVQAAGTELVWIGGASPGAMMRVGKYGSGTDVLWGGGIKNLRFNGGGQCDHGLEIGDASKGVYSDVYIWNTKVSGLHLISDGTKTNMPSAWNRFYGLFCDMRAALVASATAHGVLVEAINGIHAGVTLNYFEDLKVNHSGGDGFRWNKGGDGFVFMKPQFFRADSETGYACNFASTDAADVCNHQMFYYPIATGGFYFARAGLHTGTHIHDLDGQNINTGMGTQLLRGPGAQEVLGNTTFGELFGQSQLLSNQNVQRIDNMCLQRYDSANAIVLTAAGNWRYVGGGGAVIESGHVGGGIKFGTLATANDSTMLLASSVGSGPAIWQYPVAQFLMNVATTVNCKARWGFFDNNSDPATNGAWVEFDPAISGGGYRLICAKDGVQTAVLNGEALTGGGNPMLRWRIDFADNAINFYVSGVGTPNPQLATLLASISTNRPTANLAPGAYIKTTAAASASLDIIDFKLAHRLDYR